MMQKDSVISTPSTPNSSLSSQTNLYGSPHTPSPATPTQQIGTPALGGCGNNTAIIASNQSGTGSSSGHKNSLKGTKLAKRARSFKDDLFEKISLMRTPTNTLGRSHSPQSPRNKHKPPPTAEEVAKSSQSLDVHVKDISNALKHFRDVILKKKLEVLPGNGTVILETTASMFSVIQAYTLNDNSAVLVSATQQVYRCLGKLIKLCDEVMLSDETEECSSLSNDNVREIVDLLEEAVRNLATMAQQKLKEREELAFKYDTTSTDSQISTSSGGSNNSHNLLMRPSVEVAGQRTSLPDITLTPKERDSLEKTTSNPIRVSYSTESILRDSSPPPKPPLPNRSNNPPPLPPKRSSQQTTTTQTHAIYDTSINSELDTSTDYPLGVDHLSVRSRSPDENSSQCSFDHSREEEICQEFNMAYDKNNTEVIGGLNKLSEQHNNVSNTAKANTGLSSSATNTNSSSCTTTTTTTTSTAVAAPNDINDEDLVGGGKAELRKANNHRHSNESGFVSINSFRTSTQSYSKSSTKSSNSSSELAIMTSNNSINDDFFQLHHMTQASKKTSSVCISSTSSISESSTSALRSINNNDDERRISSPDQFEDERKMLEQLQAMTTNTNATSTSTTTTKMLMQSNSFDVTDESIVDLQPPALPPKMAKLYKERHQLSQNDLDAESINELPELRQHAVRTYQWQTKHTSLIDPRRLDKSAGSCNTINMNSNQVEEPPPLPMKKRHILAYMEICSASTRSIEQQQYRHTISACNINRNITHSQTMNLATFAKEDFMAGSDMPETPPALPPKNYKQFRNSTSPIPPTIITTPPPSPKPKHLTSDHRILMGGSGGGNEMMTTLSEEVGDQYEDEGNSGGNILHSHDLQNVYNDTSIQRVGGVGGGTNSPSPVSSDKIAVGPNGDYTSSEMEEMVNYNNYNRKSPMCTEEINHLPNILEEVDITPYLVFKKDNEDGPEVKGGYIDALIVHASRAQKDNDFSEAFITTFRTFIKPIDLIEKLTHRYTVFFCQTNDQKQKAAKETFSLLVRVVNDLTCTDLTCTSLLNLLVEFVYELVCAGQLYLAKLLRNKIVEKVNLCKEIRLPAYHPTNNMLLHNVVIEQPSLLDFKALEIAKQMTLLDAELFQKIEIPEVLIFAKDQCEEKSPNLNKFTEHFNKMSYWARSKILRLKCAKDREKYVEKFIKIMTHLKKIHNYNSYLALLSALDSAPIRRLEWNKSIKETIQNNCNIIDSSSSFRNYRQALADASPPCIPYIGLVLQDLTFVHVGNPDYLKDGVINFSKRWQQYNIIVNMKRFKKDSYTYRRNERIIRYFDNFENFLNEEEMWQISEEIKPRGKRNAVNN